VINSTEQKAAALTQTATVVHDIFQAFQEHIPVEVVVQHKDQGLKKKSGAIFVPQSHQERGGQTPDLSEIPQWRGRKQDGMALDFIQEHYGHWLSAFGAEQDAVFMDQIRKYDRRLITGIENQLREEGQGRKLGQFIKPRSARTDRELAHLTVGDLQRIPRLGSTLSSRQRRAQEAKVNPPSPTATHTKTSAKGTVGRQHSRQ
jgi:hypothetical protein